MLPVIVFVVIAIPLLLIAFIAVRRSQKSAEHMAEDSGIDEAELEREFAAADAYEEKLRDERHAHPHDHQSPG